MTNIGEVLRKYWSRMEITFAPRATTEELTVFEKSNAVQLPKEIRDYFLDANGFAPPNDQDENGFSFWPISRVTPIATFDNGGWSFRGCDNCYLFVEYLSLSWGYAFCISAGSPMVRICIVGTADQRPVFIAESIGEFVDLYVRNDDRLYPAKPVSI